MGIMTSSHDVTARDSNGVRIPAKIRTRTRTRHFVTYSSTGNSSVTVIQVSLLPKLAKYY